jgi:predicted amidohydrolase
MLPVARATRLSDRGIYWVLAFGLAVAAFIPEFRSLHNLGNVATQSAALGILAVGQTFVVLCGLIDLSVGQLTGLIVVLTCDLMAGRPAMTAPAVLLALGLGMGAGAVTGLLNNRLREVTPNLEKIDRMAGAAAGLGADLAVFPECATTGYFIADRLPALAEPPDGPVMARLAATARRHRLHLAVGLVLGEGGRYYDAQALFSPAGEPLGLYRKVHLFAAERQWYSAGDAPLVIPTALGRVGMTICYDLIFPDYVRRLVELGADLVINSTNWVADEYQHSVWGWSGKTTQGLAATRALENVTFVAMANRVGREGEFTSLGWSCVASPSGQVLASIEEGEGIAGAGVTLDGPDLARWRAIATYRSDRRPDVYQAGVTHRPR